MKLRVLILGLLGLLTFAAPAQAQDLFGYVQDLCVATRGDPALVQDLAEKGGWQAIPASVFDKPDQDKEFTGAQGWVLRTQDSFYLLLLGHSTPDTKYKMHGRLCGVGTKGEPAEDLAGRMAAFAGVASSAAVCTSPGDGPCYIWREVDGKHEPVTGDITGNVPIDHPEEVTALMLRRDTTMTLVAIIQPTQ